MFEAGRKRMDNLKLVYSFFIFFMIFSSSSSSMNNVHKCSDEQRDALLVFKQNISSTNQSYNYLKEYCEGLNGYRHDPIRMNWKTSIDCCDWDGITCNNSTGDVISLDLRCGMLQGLADLDTLLSSLPNLEAIDLSYSGLSVVTSDNGHYVNPYFYELSLASCNLTMFPDFLRAMKHLRILDLSSNYISGHIPSWAGEIGGNNLTFLDLSNNSITGLFRFRSDRLQYLDLSYNRITGLLEFRSNGLRYLDLSYNFITGLSDIRSVRVQYLYLKYNLIQGSFPPWICNMKQLKYLDISSNNISGILPQCLQNISYSLVSLNVAVNMIQGLFPTTICSMSSLLYLDMSDNNFHGVIPQCFGNITSSLAMINLEHNKFHGIIPIVYGDCGLVNVLILKGNKLEGEVPRSFSKCQSLKILDLGHNQLNGTFPRWLGDLHNLELLSLRYNNLHGTIEASSTPDFLFPRLRVFDISNNDFVGRLPETYFESLNAIKDVDKNPRTETVNISGLPYYSITHPMKGLQPQVNIEYTIIDLSNNNFDGQIPNVIGNLNSLMSLNLSINNLNGQIPDVLGDLLYMEVLDLSRNQLEGEIPQSLINLTTLEILNLSHNHLVGRIPEEYQFATFDEHSFFGNPGLCGIQLSRRCEDLSSPPPQVKADGGEWIYIGSGMFGLGFGTLLGLVLGYRMLSTGKPKWFTAIADAGEHMLPRRRKKRKPVHIRKRN